MHIGKYCTVRRFSSLRCGLTFTLPPMIHYFDMAGCAPGAPSAGCVTPFGHGHPPLKLSTSVPPPPAAAAAAAAAPLSGGGSSTTLSESATTGELGFSLWRVAAVCVGFSTSPPGSPEGGGFALLGERDKYLAVAPQRVKRMQCTESEFFMCVCLTMPISISMSVSVLARVLSLRVHAFTVLPTRNTLDSSSLKSH